MTASKGYGPRGGGGKGGRSSAPGAGRKGGAACGAPQAARAAIGQGGDSEGNDVAAAIVARVRRARDALELTGEIAPFGSHVNGLRTATSDCDLAYSLEEGGEKPIVVLQRFASELPKHGFTGIITVFQASVPLVKAVDESGVEVDLCVGNQLGLRNSKLVGAYCSLDPRVAQVGRLVKQWAKAMELVGSSDGHLNSYAFTLMTLFYLMKRRPPVIPNLQDLGGHQDLCDRYEIRDRRWGREIPWDCRFWEEISLIPKSQNTETVDALLHGFFQYYCINGAFDWREHAVSIRLATTEMDPALKSRLYSPSQPDQWYIEDPFDLRHNLCSQCSRQGRARIMDKIGETLQSMGAGANPRSGYELYCKTGPTSCMMKCRVHPEKLTVDQFISAFDSVGVGFTVHFPSAAAPAARGAVRPGDEVREAFLVFNSENDRRRVHKLNETYVGESQLRFLLCSAWAFQDVREMSCEDSYEERKVPAKHQVDEAEKTLEDAKEEVRHGLKVAQNRTECDVLIERAQALDIDWEECMGEKRLPASRGRLSSPCINPQDDPGPVDDGGPEPEPAPGVDTEERFPTAFQ